MAEPKPAPRARGKPKPHPKPKPKPKPRLKAKPRAKPKPRPAAPPPVDLDPVGTELARKISEMEVLLNVHKHHHAQIVARIQAGHAVEGDGVGELLKIIKVEQVIENKKAQLRIRAVTRCALAPT